MVECKDVLWPTYLFEQLEGNRLLYVRLRRLKWV